MTLDFDNRFGRKALRFLKRQMIVWLTTVDASGQPQPRPVWFHWDGGDLLIFSQPGRGKLRHIAGQPRVAAHFNADEDGNDVVVLLGEARTADTPVPPARLKAYVRKYREAIADLELTPESFLQDYSVPIVVRPTALRGF